MLELIRHRLISAADWRQSFMPGLDEEGTKQGLSCADLFCSVLMQGSCIFSAGRSSIPKVMLSCCFRDEVMMVVCFLVGAGMWAALPSDTDPHMIAEKRQE